ncbi:MAG: Na+/H+ antiporter subunit E [Chloroflexota bacterium]
MLFVFWIAITASFTIYNILSGLVCSFFVAFLTQRILGRGLDPDITIPFLLRFPVFALSITWEIIKANIDVAMIVINPRLPIEPRIFPVKTRLKGDLPRAVYAAVINLTPGTVVVDIQDDVFSVHGLAARHEEGFARRPKEQMIARLFRQRLVDNENSKEPTG